MTRGNVTKTNFEHMSSLNTHLTDLVRGKKPSKDPKLADCVPTFCFKTTKLYHWYNHFHKRQKKKKTQRLCTHAWYRGFFCASFSGSPSSSSNCSRGSTTTGRGELECTKQTEHKKKVKIVRLKPYLNSSIIMSARADPNYFCTYEVRRKTPSLHRSRAFLAAGLEANSTMPLPVERPRSSTMTTALSTIPN